MKAFLSKLGAVVQFVLGALILYFVGGFIILFIYNIFTMEWPDQPQTVTKPKTAQELAQEKQEQLWQDQCNSGAAKTLAYVMLRERVKQRLSAPASAKFPWANEIKINVTKPCDFAINGYVDSQNQYGAMIRTFYKGNLRRDLSNKDRFTFIKVEM